MVDNYFARPHTNADKAALIVFLLNGNLPDYGETELDALAWCFSMLSGDSMEIARKAFEDAERFGFIRGAEEIDGEETI